MLRQRGLFSSIRVRASYVKSEKAKLRIDFSRVLWVGEAARQPSAPSSEGPNHGQEERGKESSLKSRNGDGILIYISLSSFSSLLPPITKQVSFVSIKRCANKTQKEISGSPKTVSLHWRDPGCDRKLPQPHAGHRDRRLQVHVQSLP